MNFKFFQIKCIWENCFKNTKLSLSETFRNVVGRETSFSFDHSGYKNGEQYNLVQSGGELAIKH